jgi:hypothetical protein
MERQLVNDSFSIFPAVDQARVLQTDAYGRRFLQCVNQRKCIGYIKIFYCSRALEWLNIRRLFHDILCLFQFSHLYSLLEDITFAWSYDATIASFLYEPAMVFKKFFFANILDSNQQCACMTAKRLQRFCDPHTLMESSSFTNPGIHV